MGRRSYRLLFAGCLATLVTNLVSTEALAADPPRDRDTMIADQLFQEGRRLMDQGRTKDACDKFKESLDKATGVGAMLNLGDCQEKMGNFASAWKTFKDAELEAKLRNKEDRERTARQRRQALEPKLAKVVFVIADKGDKTLEVHRDGVVVDDISGPVPTDPGPHKIEVTAKGKKPFVMNIDVAQGAVQQKVEVPALEAENAPTANPNGDPKNAAAEVQPASSGSSPLRTVGLVTAGVGVLGIGAGTYFGIRTYSMWNDVLSRCSNVAECDEQGKALHDDAVSSGTLSTVAFAAGGILTVGGVVLYIIAPKGRSGSEARRTIMYPLVSGGNLGAEMVGRF